MMPHLMLLLVVVGSALALGSVVDTRHFGQDTYTLDVESPATWHPFLGKWSLGAIDVSESPSRVLEFDAYLRNALSTVTSDARTVTVTLRTPQGEVLDTQTERTHRAGLPILTDTTDTVRVSFLHVSPGDYLLRAELQDADGKVEAQASRAVHLLGDSP